MEHPTNFLFENFRLTLKNVSSIVPLIKRWSNEQLFSEYSGLRGIYVIWNNAASLNVEWMEIFV